MSSFFDNYQLAQGLLGLGGTQGMMNPAMSLLGSNIDQDAMRKYTLKNMLLGSASALLSQQPSTMPINFGTTLGQGLAGGLQQGQTAQQDYIKNAVLAQQMKMQNQQMQLNQNADTRAQALAPGQVQGQQYQLAGDARDAANKAAFDQYVAGLPSDQQALAKADPTAFANNYFAVKMMGARSDMVNKMLNPDTTPGSINGSMPQTPQPQPPSASWDPSGAGAQSFSSHPSTQNSATPRGNMPPSDGSSGYYSNPQNYASMPPSGNMPPQPNATAPGLSSAGGPPSLSNSPISMPPQLRAGVAMAGMQDLSKAAELQQGYVLNQDQAARDAYYKSPAYTGNQAYTGELYKALGAPVVSAINNGAAAFKQEKILNEMSDIVNNHWDDVSSGPGSASLLQLKQLAHSTFGLDFGSDAKYSEVLGKLNMQLASMGAKDYTSRPTQFELGAFQKANPGLSLTREGNAGLLNIKLQQVQYDKQLADILSQPGVASDPYKANQIIKQFDADHPIISPWDGKTALNSDTQMAGLTNINAKTSGPAPTGTQTVKVFQWTPDKGLHQ